MTKLYLQCCCLFILSSFFNVTNAALINFETVPGGSPSDQLAISDQYLSDYGVTFSLDDGGTPFLEKTGTGDSGHGFWNPEFSTYDVESTGYAGELGNYFLRFGTSTFSDTPGPILVIEYANPVSAASAQIWDLDAAQGGTNGWEAWTITARDNSGSVIDTIVSPDGIDETLPDSLNGKPWTWSFDRDTDDIHSIAIGFTGTAGKVGLAFDNFSPSTAVIPVPAALWLFSSGLIGLIGFARHEKVSRLFTEQ